MKSRCNAVNALQFANFSILARPTFYPTCTTIVLKFTILLTKNLAKPTWQVMLSMLQDTKEISLGP